MTRDPEAAGGKHGLLIGIDEYPLLGEGYRLRGCVRDVELVADVLRESFGFPASGLTLLRGGEATAEAIRGSLAALRARVAPGDTVVVHYSGHGSWRRSAASPSGREETLIPVDSGRDPHPNRDVADIEIEEWLAGLGRITPFVTLLFDSCFSGSITRDPFARPRAVPGDPRPPAGDAAPARAARRDAGDRGPSGWARPGDRYVLLAACRADESAFEWSDPARPDEVHGALTYHLCKALVTEDRRRPATYRDLWEAVAGEVTAAFPAQHPQLEGARDRLVLGSGELRPRAFLPVGERAGGRVTLGGGSLHGVTAGSEWGVHPPGTRSPREDGRLGRVRVLTPSALRSEAEVLTETAAAVTAGCRAFEEARAPGEMRLVLAVATPPAERARLEAALVRSLLLRTAGPGEKGDLQVYAVAPRNQVRPGDPVPQLGPLDAGVWAAVGGDGRLQVPAVPLAAPGGEARLVENLERWARHRNLRRLENPDPDSPLRGRVELTLLRRRPGGAWEEPAAGRTGEAGGEEGGGEGGEGGELVYREGDHLGVRVRNRHDAPLYVHVFDLGLAGGVHLLYPPPGAVETLAAGGVLEIGLRPADELELYLPDGFPVDPGAAAEGQEAIEVLATSCPSDFTPLVQHGFRAGLPPGAGGGGALGELLRLALAGQGSREVRAVRAPAGEEWTAVGRSFLLRSEGA